MEIRSRRLVPHSYGFNRQRLGAGKISPDYKFLEKSSFKADKSHGTASNQIFPNLINVTKPKCPRLAKSGLSQTSLANNPLRWIRPDRFTVSIGFVFCLTIFLRN